MATLDSPMTGSTLKITTPRSFREGEHLPFRMQESPSGELLPVVSTGSTHTLGSPEIESSYEFNKMFLQFPNEDGLYPTKVILQHEPGLQNKRQGFTFPCILGSVSFRRLEVETSIIISTLNNSPEISIVSGRSEVSNDTVNRTSISQNSFTQEGTLLSNRAIELSIPNKFLQSNFSTKLYVKYDTSSSKS